MKSHRFTDAQRHTARPRKLPLAVVLPLSASLVLGMPAPAAFAGPDTVQATQVQPSAPEADCLDVTFENGTAADAAQGRAMETFGSPQIAVDGQLARGVADFDGESAYSYALESEDYAAMQDGFTVECGFMATGATTGEDTFCGNKEAGGWAMVVRDDRVGFMIHTDGNYTFAWADIDVNRWYHAAGVYDGETIQLYFDGELAAEA
ncbi:hypothetical protein GCM10023190_22650 [Enteractinococcus fodinae]|uniref:LamG domain-containing protein n=1 Tax=Enteractinococcus fodinae TaxID=684663 RepID=A0ABU2B319_9MICC|nr:LamG-like jellyroll fold domain-containing protein [Enteractinococcus fodinae]MDR7347976.1 hypothetical protein [Enteractinococcus fodinae]